MYIASIPEIIAHASTLNKSDRALQRRRGAGDRSPGAAPLAGFSGPRQHRLERSPWWRGRDLYGFKDLPLFEGECDPAEQPRYLPAFEWPTPYPALINIVSLIGGGLRALIGRKSGRNGSAAPALRLPLH
jgi:hypothetical protein